MKKKLWMAFGPLLVATLILLGLLFSPFKITHINSKTERQAATSLSPNVLKGEAIKRAALAKHKYIPFFGSSEFSRFDLAHPAVLAAKYKRDYRPFLMGNPGTASLTHYFQMQLINKQLKHKKAVFVISPQWFVPRGSDPKAFSFYFSTMQAVDFILKQHGTVADRYAAKRLLATPSGTSNEQITRALDKVRDGKPISATDRTYFKLYMQLLRKEDQLFSGIRLQSNEKVIRHQMKKLPAQDNQKLIEKAVTKEAKKETTNNDFGIKNSFFKKRLKGDVSHLRGVQRKINYTKSPEFSDFQLVLNQFAKDHTNVLFIIPPVNQKWIDYTGLSREMLAGFDRKVTYQLKSQGFNNILDLSQDGNEKYFMEDTIHLGWNGWLAVDKRVHPFIDNKQPTPKYKINDKFYSNTWQQLAPSDVNQFAKK